MVGFFLLIPAFVMLHMVFVWNQHRMGETVRSEQNQPDLQDLVDFYQYYGKTLFTVSHCINYKLTLIELSGFVDPWLENW